ncbi:GIY-YIG nuclease family protein [Kaarinaea lacus]
MQNWYVYMVRCSDGSLYTGLATDVQRRIEEHNCSDRLAAKYTRTRRPVHLVYSERCNSRSQAAQREAQLKRLNRMQKQDLIATSGAICAHVNINQRK